MRLSDEKFFNEVVDHSILELNKASELFNDGKKTEAEKCFADYIRTVFPNEKTKPRHY